MTIEEAKQAFLHRIPVEHDGIRYPYIFTLQYTWKRGVNTKNRDSTPIIQLELMDKNQNSIVVAAPGKVKLAGELPRQELTPPPKLEGNELILYEYGGVRMAQRGDLYFVNVPGRQEYPVISTDNKLSAFTKFIERVDSLIRRDISEEMIKQNRDRYTGERL